MGQRSQIYVIAKKNNRYYLTANYYQWNYGERMVSRARGILENIINDYIKHDWYLTTETQKLRRVMDINWDMHDIVISTDIVKEFEEFYPEIDTDDYVPDFFMYCFSGQDNNDGQLYFYIDLDAENPKVKMCFIKHTISFGCAAVDVNEYLNGDIGVWPYTWKEHMIKSEYYDEETILYTERNVKYIENNSEMLSIGELFDIIQNVAIQFEKDHKDKEKRKNAGDI